MASSFKILNSSTGIPPHPLALLTVGLPKAHLTSLPRMSGSEWLTSSAESSVRLDFSHSSSMYSFHLFLTSSVSTRALPFMSSTVPTFRLNVALVSPVFLKRALVSPPFSSSSFTRWSLKKAFLCLPAVLWKSAFGRLSLPFLPCFLVLLSL